MWKIIILLSCCIAMTNCDCRLNLPSSLENIPTYTKSFGSKRILIHHNNDYIHLNEGEQIFGYCDTSFNDFYCKETEMVKYVNKYERIESKKFMKGLRDVSLKCDNNKMYNNVDELLATELSCKSIDLDMYESTTSFSWCPPATDSYFLATKSLQQEIILAALCFNVDNMLMETLHYMVGPNATSHNHKMPVLNPGFNNIYHLGTATGYINTKFSGDETELAKMRDDNHWLQLANYEYKSIIIEGLPINNLEKLETLLNVVWWPNLRYGNWKRFTDALTKQANNFTYNIYTGTSGMVQVPTLNKCAHNNFEKLKYGHWNRTIPAYVWTYLEATELNEDFVVIGFNSPFYEFYDKKDVIFCEDICDQISWLTDVRDTFRYSSIGITFCCSVEEVRNNTDVLDGFPLYVDQTTTTTTTTTTQSNLDTTTISPINVGSLENLIMSSEENNIP